MFPLHAVIPSGPLHRVVIETAGSCEFARSRIAARLVVDLYGCLEHGQVASYPRFSHVREYAEEVRQRK